MFAVPIRIMCHLRTSVEQVGDGTSSGCPEKRLTPAACLRENQGAQLQNSCSLWVLSCSLPSNFSDKLTFEMGEEKRHLREAKGFKRKRMVPEMVPAMVPVIVGHSWCWCRG